MFLEESLRYYSLHNIVTSSVAGLRPNELYTDRKRVPTYLVRSYPM